MYIWLCIQWDLSTVAIRPKVLATGHHLRQVLLYVVLNHKCIPVTCCIIQGVGTVISGTCMQGVIKLSDTLLLGPTSLGEFVPVPIRSIQRKRLPVTEVRGGQTASFALKKVSVKACYVGTVKRHQ